MNLPEPLIQSLQNIKGFSEEAFKQVHHSGGQVTSIRINPFKFPASQIPPLGGGGAVPWSSNGYYLPQRPSFTLDPLFHAGAYYVQEASSMFLEEAIRQTVDLSQPLKVLDLCAAPGGKSTLIQSIISKESLLVSNEVIKPRANILAENITKWGAANVIVTNNDPKDFQRLPNYFDLIVVDAPCSGSGLFRKDPAAIEEWSENNVALCAQRQQRILADIMPSLKEGGVLIYSTCSYSKQENEAIAGWLNEEFKVESLKFKVEEAWGIVETVSENGKAFGYRFYPDKVKGEGFFIAAFQKKVNEEEFELSKRNQSQRPKKKLEKIPAKELDTIRPYLYQFEKFTFIKQADDLLALPACLEDDLPLIQSTMYIKKAGVKIGKVIRDELIPNHELAASTILSADTPRLEVSLENALQYLRREILNIETDKKGWLLVTYQRLPLGWIKALPNRINNYYPQSWRILNK